MKFTHKSMEKEYEDNVLMNPDAHDFVWDYAADNGTYIMDAIAEYADANTSIYYNEQRDYALTHYDTARDVIREGLAPDASEYFRSNPQKDFDDYVCMVGACAEYRDIEERLFRAYPEIVYACVLMACDEHNNCEKLLDSLPCYDDNQFQTFGDIWDFVNDAAENLKNR